MGAKKLANINNPVGLCATGLFIKMKDKRMNFMMIIEHQIV